MALIASVFFLTAASTSHDVDAYKTAQADFSDGEAHFMGSIIDSVKKVSGRTLLIVNVTEIDARPVHLTMQLTLTDAAAAKPFLVGHVVEFRARAKRYEPAPSPVHFDQQRFGFTRGYHASAIVDDPDAIIIGEKISQNYFATLRAQFRKKILAAVSPQETAMLLALLVGDTSFFADDDKDVFSAIGAQHLLAVSGLQISLLAWLIFAFFYPLIALLMPAKYFHYAKLCTAIITSLALFWFTALTGFSTSAVRALIMAIILFLPTIVERRIDIFDALFASALLTLLISPSSAHDLGFLLSYVAVFGILVANTRSTIWRASIKSKSLVVSYASDALLYSLAAALATMPILALAFQTFAPFSVVANAMLVPIAAVTQIPAIILSAAGAVFNSPSLVAIAAFFANLIDMSAHILARFFGGVFVLPYLSALAWFSLAIALNLFFFCALKRSTSLFALAIALLIVPITNLFKNHELEVTVIPVGQGDSTLFSFDNGAHMLIDAGGSPHLNFDPGAAYVVPTLKRHGIRELDVMLISHPDPDHILGAFAVIDAIRVKEIWHSGFRDKHPLTKKLIAKAHEHNIAIKTTTEISGTHRFGKSLVEIIAPVGEDYYRELSANDNSLVVRIIHGQHRLLWPGDIEYFGEQLLLESKTKLSATILKAPHHGSRTSSTEAFIAAVNPRDVIFSTGIKNIFNFPHDDVVARYQSHGARMWNTATNGEITIKIDQSKISIAGYLFQEKT